MILVIIDNKGRNVELNIQLFRLSQIFQQIAMQRRSHKDQYVIYRVGIQDIQTSKIEWGCKRIFKTCSKNAQIRSENSHLSRRSSVVSESLWHNIHVSIACCMLHLFFARLESERILSSLANQQKRVTLLGHSIFPKLRVKSPTHSSINQQQGMYIQNLLKECPNLFKKLALK